MRWMDHPGVLGHLSSKAMALKWMDACVSRGHLAASTVSLVTNGEWVLLDIFSGSGPKMMF